MPVKPLHSIILSIALMCSAGCASLRPAADQLPPPEDSAAYVQKALDVPQQACQAGVARITIKVKNTSQSYKTIYASRYPDELRLEILGLFNQPGLYISADRQTGITLYAPSKNAWYRGPATAESMQRLSGILMDPFDIVKTLHNSPPGPKPANSHSTCTQDKDLYKCRLETEGSVQEIWINPLSGHITQSRLFKNGVAGHDINYRDFIQSGERSIPEKILIHFKRYATSLEIKLQDPLTGPLTTEQLNLQAPEGTVFLPLNAFFEAK